MDTGQPAADDVSVVMATYNGERHLAEQLHSILNQTLPPREVVITDDQSSDGTVAIARRFAADSPVPIRVHVNPERLGYGSNFLRAARLSSGRYISFSDQDDIWHPNKLQRSMAVLERAGVGLVAHQMNLVDEHGDFIRLDRHGTKRTVRFEPNQADPFGVFFGFTMTFDRRLLDLLPEQERGADSFRPGMALAHDRWVYFLGTTFGSAQLLAEPLADYRQHGTQSFGITEMTLLDRVRTKQTEGRSQVVALMRIARHRHQLLERGGSASAEEPAPPAVWRAASRRWSRISSYTTRRARTYLAPSLFARSVFLTANLCLGAYRSHRSGGLGRRHFLEDLVVGVAGPLSYPRGARRSAAAADRKGDNRSG